MHPPLRILTYLLPVFLAAGVAHPQEDPCASRPQLKLSARIVEEEPLGLGVALKIENEGETARISLGSLFADDYLRPNLTLRLLRGNQRYSVLSREEPQHPEGKVEPLTVVLSKGSSYVLDQPFRQYVVIVTGANDPTLDDFFTLGDELQIEMNVEAYDQGCQKCNAGPRWKDKLNASAGLP